MRPHFPFVLAPVALASFLLPTSGCYVSHQRDGGGSHAGADASTRRDGGATDAIVPPPPPPPPRCVLTETAEREVATHPDGSMHAPDLFSLDGRIGVLLFQSDTVAHPVITMTSVDPPLRDVAPLRQVGEESHGWGEAAAAGDAIGVCWNGDPGGLSRLRFRELSGFEGPLGRRIDFDPEDGPCMDLELAHGLYGMTWRHQYEVLDEYVVDAVFQTMTRDGERIGERILLGGGPYPGPTPFLLATEDGFLVGVHAEDHVRIVETDPRGHVTREATIDAPGVSYAVAAMRDDRIALLSLAGPRETRSLELRILDRDLSVLSTRVIEDGGPTASHPRIAARPEGWAAVWGSYSQPTDRAWIMSLDPDGRPLAPRRILYPGRHSGYGGPSLLSTESSLFVGLSHGPLDMPGARETAHVVRFDCDEPAADLCRAEEVRRDCDDDEVAVPRWRFTGDRCEPLFICPRTCGEDCEHLALTRFACESDHRECGLASCAPLDATLTRACAPAEAPSGTASVVTIELPYAPCACMPPPACSARVTAPSEVTLAVETCGGEISPDCDCAPVPPVPFELGCVLPLLQPGEWTVRVEGTSLPLIVRAPWEEARGDVTCHELSGE